MAVTIKGFASDWSVPVPAQTALDALYSRKGAHIDNAADYASLQAWLDGPNKNKYLPAGNYPITTGLTSTAPGAVIEGPGRITSTTTNLTLLTINGADTTVRGITFDGTGAASIGVQINAAGCTVEDCTVANLGSPDQWTRGIAAETLGAVTISRNVVRDLTAVGNATLGDGVGAVRGIYLWRNGTPTGPALIDGNTVTEIHGEEGDAIQILGGAATDTVWRSLTTVSNNRVHNANRRGLKIQAAGTTVEGNTVTTDATLSASNPSNPINVIHSHYSVVRHNYVNAPQLNAVPVSVVGNSTTRSVGVEVYGNTVHAPSTQHAMYGDYLSFAIISENRIYGGSRAIALGNTDDTVVARNVESGGPTSSAAVFVTSAGNRVRTLGNVALTQGRKATQNESANGTDDSAASYDSGRRNILSLATTATGGNLTLRRVGYTVEIVAYNVVFTGMTLVNLPAEFRPALTASYDTAQWAGTGSERLRVRSDTGNVEFYGHTDANAISFVASYQVVAGAPTSAPGVAA